MKTRKELLEELITSFVAEINEMVEYGNTHNVHYETLEDRLTETKIQLWEEIRTTGN